jgi:phospholipase/carboxylesterase
MTEMNQPELVESGSAFETAGLVHRVLEPTGNEPRPTAVLLHGRSGNEDVMWIFQRALPKDWLVVAPRAIQDDPAGGYAWHPRQPDEWPTLAMFDEAVSAVIHFIKALPKLYRADPKQIHLMGFSQGAATAFATAMRHPDLVRSIAGLVGFAPENCEAEVESGVLNGLPIFMPVGAEDTTIPLARSRQSAEVLRTAGADLTYQEYETGHKLNAQGMRALKEWFSKR